MWKLVGTIHAVSFNAISFSPLAGIRYVETNAVIRVIGSMIVSVPLRGLDMWKPLQWSQYKLQNYRFSPLAGIRYVETPPSET